MATSRAKNWTDFFVSLSPQSTTLIVDQRLVTLIVYQRLVALIVDQRLVALIVDQRLVFTK